MHKGSITGNTASIELNPNTNYSMICGGGVYVGYGAFEMKDGVIAGNSASTNSSSPSAKAQGGGVYAGNRFTKTGGIIYGSDAADAALKNTLSDGGGGSEGFAVYAKNQKRNTTADASVNLDSTVSGPPWD
jgi:hypothetical protein